jgi:hypothetical protein
MTTDHRELAERFLASADTSMAAALEKTLPIEDQQHAAVLAGICTNRALVHAMLATAPGGEKEAAPLVRAGLASETVSRNVRRLRTAHGWTQEEAGQYLGQITGSTWSKAVWSMAETQTRPREWTATELVALTYLFDVTLADLFATGDVPF